MLDLEMVPVARWLTGTLPGGNGVIDIEYVTADTLASGPTETRWIRLGLSAKQAADMAGALHNLALQALRREQRDPKGRA